MDDEHKIKFDCAKLVIVVIFVCGWWISQEKNVLLLVIFGTVIRYMYHVLL